MANIEDANYERYPHFSESEIFTGRVLGSGEFGIVFEIKAIELSHERTNYKTEESSFNEHSSEGLGGIDESEQIEDFTILGSSYHSNSSLKMRRGSMQSNLTNHSRIVDEMFQCSASATAESMAAYCLRGMNQVPRYAVKKLNFTHRTKKKKTHETFTDQNLTSLQMECYLLSLMSHPNIIKLRGIADVDPKERKFFFVIDCLSKIFDARLYEWKDECNRLTSFLSKLRKDRSKMYNRHIMNRLVSMIDMVSAIVYLHSKQIIYRDLKPENIGFDVRGTLKMFDFNVSRIMPKSHNGDDDETFLMTFCGNRRFMAPEILSRQKYNLKADIFSVGLLLYQIISLKTPFKDMSEDEHMHAVKVKQIRPRISSVTFKRWPLPTVKDIIINAWDNDMKKRPSAAKIKMDLNAIARIFEGSDDDYLNRSENMLNLSNLSSPLTDL